MRVKRVHIETMRADTTLDIITLVHPLPGGLIGIPNHMNHMEDLTKVLGDLTVGRARPGQDQDGLKTMLYQHKVRSITASTMTCRIPEVGAALYKGVAQHCKKVVEGE